jgi:DNA mismatch repair protein MutL
MGDELARRLIRVQPVELKDIRVWGFIGGPGLSRSSRQQQLTFLNGRPIESSSINYGLREGFHTSLMKGQHPVTFLFIEMDAVGYDINVHPAKKEVRFHDGFAVRDAVAKAVSQALESASKLPEGHTPPSTLPRATLPVIAVPQQQSFAMHTPAVPFALKTDPTNSTPTSTASVFIPEEPPVIVPARGTSSPDEPVETQVFPDQVPEEKPTPVPKPERPDFRIIGVLHRLYILLESTEGLVLMDQHAAHERVNFEKMRRAMELGGVPSQRLLMPLTLQVSPRDADILRRHQETLGRLGIDIEPFGPNIFKVEALPTFLKTDDPLSWLDQIIEELQTLSAKGSNLRLGEDMIATTVCRHSIKANDKLSIPEIEALLRDLFACEMPYCCPHGRPTLIQMSLKELEKKFGRLAP